MITLAPWHRHPNRLEYEVAYALCALGSGIMYIDHEGFYCGTELPHVLQEAYERGAHSFYEMKKSGSL